MKRSLTSQPASATGAGGGGTSGYTTVADLYKGLYPAVTQGPWVRPADWLALPVINATDEKAAALVAIYADGSTYASYSSSAATNVDWGDGSSVQAVPANTLVSHLYSYAGRAGTTSSRGFRQAVMVITPQSGSLGTMNFTRVLAAENAATPSPIVELVVNSPTATGILLTPASGTILANLEHLKLHLPLVTSFTNGLQNAYALRKIDELTLRSTFDAWTQFFQNCRSLEEVCDLDMSGATSISSLFSGCTSLKKSPKLLNTSKVTNANAVFSGCSSLREVQSFDTSKVTTFITTFNPCVALEYVPAFDISAAQTTASMFSGCSSLVKVEDFTGTPIALTTLSSMFLNCSSLRKAPAMNTFGVTSMSGMFSGCSSLREFPNYDFRTVADLSNAFVSCVSLVNVPNLDLTAATTLTGMFSGCAGLATVGDLSTGSGLTIVQSMFANCSALQAGPLFSDTSAVVAWSSMFNNCSRLLKVPAYDTSSATAVNNMFTSCTSLRAVPALNLGLVSSANGFLSMVLNCSNLSRMTATGIKFTFSLNSTHMDVAAINEFFTNLPVVSGQTISISSTLGATINTGLDRTIATNKGWTVTG